MEKFIKGKEVCEILSISNSTLKRMLADKKIPVYKIGNQNRFKVSDLEQYMEGVRQ